MSHKVKAPSKPRVIHLRDGMSLSDLSEMMGMGAIPSKKPKKKAKRGATPKG